MSDHRSPADQFRYLMSGTEDARRNHMRKAGGVSKLGGPSDLTAQDVIDLFSLPDDDDSMHAQPTPEQK
jgi:hypothetical protein